jgi:predicted nucleic acid-binding protein
MRQIFLDSGYVVALEGTDDQHHAPAIAHWKAFRRQKPRLVTTSLVFAEIIAFVLRRGRHDVALRVGQSLLKDQTIEMIHVDQALFESGWDYFRRHSDKRYSLTDCVSFVVMEQRGIRQALAFDRHFEQAGFERLPQN